MCSILAVYSVKQECIQSTDPAQIAPTHVYTITQVDEKAKVHVYKNLTDSHFEKLTGVGANWHKFSQM